MQLFRYMEGRRVALTSVALGKEGTGKVLMGKRNGACSGRLQRTGGGAPIQLALRLISASAV